MTKLSFTPLLKKKEKHEGEVGICEIVKVKKSVLVNLLALLLCYSKHHFDSIHVVETDC